MLCTATGQNAWSRRHTTTSQQDKPVMQYALVIHETPEDFAKRNSPTESGPYWGAWGAYIQQLTEAGIMAGGNGLQGPETATMVRVRDGKRHLQDGHYAETKEMLGGIIVIEAPDLDTALSWAERCPAASYATVEVRPVLPPNS